MHCTVFHIQSECMTFILKKLLNNTLLFLPALAQSLSRTQQGNIPVVISVIQNDVLRSYDYQIHMQYKYGRTK